MNLFIVVKCDSIEGPWETSVYHSRTEALEQLETEYENLCPTDGDLEIEFDSEEGRLSWIDADMSCKNWVCIEEVYLNHAKEVF